LEDSTFSNKCQTNFLLPTHKKKTKNKKGGKEKENFCTRNEKMAQDGKQEEHGPNDFLEGINVL
jgi:hypothetical protein